jgi:hypothetical protein
MASLSVPVTAAVMSSRIFTVIALIWTLLAVLISACIVVPLAVSLVAR